MRRRDDSTRLRHMLHHAQEAASLVRGKSREDLDADRVLALALVHLLEIVGEATNRVSEDTRRQHPAIPWSQIVGLRNRLVHGYDAVDMDILWQVLQQDLPGLIAELGRLVPPDAQR